MLDNTNFKKVKDFMIAYDQEILDKPSLPTFDVAKLRTELIREEYTELIDAINKMDIVEIDALTDLLYVTYDADMQLILTLTNVLKKCIIQTCLKWPRQTKLRIQSSKLCS